MVQGGWRRWGTWAPTRRKRGRGCSAWRWSGAGAAPSPPPARGPSRGRRGGAPAPTAFRALSGMRFSKRFPQRGRLLTTFLALRFSKRRGRLLATFLDLGWAASLTPPCRAPQRGRVRRAGAAQLRAADGGAGGPGRGRGARLRQLRAVPAGRAAAPRQVRAFA